MTPRSVLLADRSSDRIASSKLLSERALISDTFATEFISSFE